MKIAVIGSGISGLSSAWLLDRRHQVTLFEASSYLGGHTNTVDVELDGVTHPADTGFLVFNELTYPNLIKLFDHLGVSSSSTEMTFSVNLPALGIEWAGSNLATVFAQRRNLLRLHFWRMLGDILRFNRKAPQLLVRSQQSQLSLGGLLDMEGYSEAFSRWYLLPMAAAIWSSPSQEILRFPAETFLRFCLNHHLLQVNDRPQWRSVKGGGRCYVERMSRSLRTRLNTPVRSITRSQEGVRIETDGLSEVFDAVVIATHPPETLKMLTDADAQERNILGSVRYQPNRAILHTDRGFLPQRKELWSAWNYLSAGQQNPSVCVTYLLNKLQKLPFQTPLMVTLNPPADCQPEGEIAQFDYDHPLFDQAAIEAQGQLSRIQGKRNTWFCGAWCGYGFHEDGLKSALRIIGDFDVEAPWKAVL